MQITRNNLSDTKVTLDITIDSDLLTHSKQHAIDALSKDVKVPGFRAGKAPAAMVEKAISPSVLQEEFLNHAINHAYSTALVEEKVNAASQPSIEVTKFVPYTTVEFKATLEIIGPVKLADYKKLKSTKVETPVSKEQVQEVIENIRTQFAVKKDVELAAKIGDQVWLDFDGKDDKGKEVKGAKGTNYPLTLGSNAFIPGFEEHVIGLKTGDDKQFTISFPKDYSVKALQSKKVTFAVSIIKVQEIEKPPIDEELIKKVSPELSTLKELEADIRKQLKTEAEKNSQRTFENTIIAELVEKSEVVIPEGLVNEQAENVMRELRQNISYRGQTFEEYLEAVGMTEVEQREKEILPEANRRLKAGLILNEIANREDITVSEEEQDIRVSVLKQRYPSDPEMQKQLDSANGRREVGSQLMTEKTVAKIISFNNGKKT